MREVMFDRNRFTTDYIRIFHSRFFTMRKFRHFVMLSLLVIITSCAETKQFAYFQDMSNDGVTPQVSMPVDIKAQVGDQLSININAQDDRLQKMFNLSMVSSGGSSNQTRLVYTVDSKGCITLPVLGEVKVLGLTREQIAALVSQELKARELLSDPVVVVQFQNAFVSVLGDVGNPGRINFDKDNMTIIDAIAQAGDLQATGKRARVFVLRQVNGKQQMYAVDMAKAESIYSSPVYYLQQNDVVYVEPNAMKARTASVNGNTFRTVGFWMSVSSFLMSLIVLITK